MNANEMIPIDAMKLAQDDASKLRAALREIAGVLDKGGLDHAMSCHGPDGCGCEIAEIRAIVERAVGGES